jgi:hypothetical protein
MKLVIFGLGLLGAHAALFGLAAWADPVHVLLSRGAGAGLGQVGLALGFLGSRLAAELLAPGLIAAGLVWRLTRPQATITPKPPPADSSTTAHSLPVKR